MRFFKWVRNIVIVFIAIMIIAISTGFIYEVVSERKDLKKYPAPGQIINVDGHDMHIYSEGKGAETVVFSAGWGIECPYVEYSPIYTKLSPYTRIAVYDRPGYGWSEVANTPRDIDTISKELHSLLELSDEKPPYILVGHSMASLELIRFAQLYPNEVKGIVMVDAGNPDYFACHETIQGALSGSKLKSILQKTSIMRILFQNDDFIKSAYASRNHFELISSEMKEMDKALYLINLTNKNKDGEITNFYENAKIVKEGGDLGKIPLMILTAEKSDTDIETNTEWRKSQEDFLKWSQNSEMKVVEKANHYFYQYTPDIVVDYILKICK